MFCEQCGNKLQDGKRFCPKCGTKTGIEKTENIDEEVKAEISSNVSVISSTVKNNNEISKKPLDHFKNKKVVAISVVALVLIIISASFILKFIATSKNTIPVDVNGVPSPAAPVENFNATPDGKIIIEMLTKNQEAYSEGNTAKIRADLYSDKVHDDAFKTMEESLKVVSTTYTILKLNIVSLTSTLAVVEYDTEQTPTSATSGIRHCKKSGIFTLMKQDSAWKVYKIKDINIEYLD